MNKKDLSVGRTFDGDAIYRVKDYVKSMKWTSFYLRLPNGKEVLRSIEDVEGTKLLMNGFHIDGFDTPVIYVL